MKPAPLPADELRRLRLLQELRIPDAEPDPDLQALARLACAHTGWPIGAVSLIDTDRHWFAAAVGLDVRTTPRDDAFCLHTLFGADRLEVPDARADPRFADSVLVSGALQVRAYAAVPVLVDGLRIGSVCAMHHQPRRVSEAGLAALHDLARVTGALLDARLRAQRARLQEARVRGASRAGSDWLWESDVEGRVTWVSDSVEAHTGLPPSHDIGRLANEIHRVRPDDRAAWDGYRLARERRQPFRNAVAERDTPRGTISVSLSGDPVFDSAGRFRGFRGAARNVTAELTERARARRREQLLLDAIERLNAALVISDAEGRVVLSNALWRSSVLQFLPEIPPTRMAVLRALLEAGAYPDARGREEEWLAARLALPTPEGARQQLRLGDQHVLVIEQRLPDGGVIQLSLDVTAQRDRELQLAAQEARLRAMLHAQPDLWFVIDADGRFVDCSDERHPWLARPFTEMRGRRFADVLPPELARQAHDAVLRTLGSGEVQRFEYDLVTLDDIARSFEARLSPMPGSQVLYIARDLTGVRQLERDVAVMQRALEAETALPMVVTDATQADLPIMYCNAAFERLTGYLRSEVMGRNCRFLQGGERDQPGLTELRRALREGRGCTVTVRNRRSDGPVFINQLHLAPVHDHGGRLTHYIGVLSDVTERSRAADQLALSEALYRSVATSITDGLMVLGPDGTVVTANPSACRVLQRNAAELIGRPLQRRGFDLLHEDGRPVAAETSPVSLVLRYGQTVPDRVYRLLRADGSERVLRLSAQPLRLQPDDPMASCVITFRDVTEERVAAAALQRAEARWKFALDGAGGCVWDYDEDSQFTFYSPRWKAMLGYREDEIGGSLLEWSRRIHPDDFEGVMLAIRRYRAGETPSYETQHRLRHKDGQWIWVLDRGEIVERHPDGRIKRVVGTHTDITRQKLAEQALREKQALELASQAKSQFLSRMSHEMRTPLNAVIGFTQLLRLHGSEDPQQLKQYSEHILAAGEHLLALVNDVLDLQQVEEGRLSLQLEPLMLCDVVNGALEMLEPLARKRAIVVINEVPHGPLVRADAQRLRQVLLNVLSNAIKYNREGGHLRCSLLASESKRSVLLVDDNGPGMSREQLARLFQPFERLGLETSTIEGTGLGLIIARRLIEEMGGSLRIGSRVGHGTRVRIELTDAGEMSSVAQAPDDSAPDRVAKLTRDGDAGALRMLYVEDNPVNALLFEEAIRLRGGIDLRIAVDGDEALRLAAAWQPELLVLDAHLPGISGFEVLAQLRTLPGLARTPAFMCSADAMPEDVQRALEAGFAGYWTKPIDVVRVMTDLDALHAGHPSGFAALEN